MSIPVYINQDTAGVLTVMRDGLYTVLEARAPKAEGFVRLWAHGGGKSAYLGLMQPTDGGLVLRRRLSRRELAAYPDPIEAVSDRERDTEDSHNDVSNKEVDIINNTPEAASEKSAAISREEAANTDESDTENSLHKTYSSEEADPIGGLHKSAGSEEESTSGLHKTESDCRSCPWPAEVPEEGLLWYSRGDGSLTAFDGVSSLLALPAELRTPDDRAAERVIEGKKYLVFRY